MFYVIIPNWSFCLFLLQEYFTKRSLNTRRRRKGTRQRNTSALHGTLGVYKVHRNRYEFCTVFLFLLNNDVPKCDLLYGCIAATLWNTGKMRLQFLALVLTVCRWWARKSFQIKTCFFKSTYLSSLLFGQTVQNGW